MEDLKNSICDKRLALSKIRRSTEDNTKRELIYFVLRKTGDYVGNRTERELEMYDLILSETVDAVTREHGGMSV